MIRNERFRVALDYLYKNGLVADQRELSVKTGLSQKSISHILNNRVQNPSEATIRKLNEAFGNIFNPEYFPHHSRRIVQLNTAATFSALAAPWMSVSTRRGNRHLNEHGKKGAASLSGFFL